MSAQQALPSDADPAAIRLLPVPEFWPLADCAHASSPPAGAQPGPLPRDMGIVHRCDLADSGQAWPRQFAVALAETLAGVRPVRQIQPWLSKRGSAHLHRVLPLFASGHQPRVQRVIAARPAPDVIEMTLIITVGSRTRALAARLEQARPTTLERARTTPESTPLEQAGARTARTTSPAARPDQAARAVRWVCTDIEAA